MGTHPPSITRIKAPAGSPVGQAVVPECGGSRVAISAFLLAAGLLLGCTPPVLRQAESKEIHTGRLAFLADGRTTREEVLLRLGTPSARFEGERILTYAYLRNSEGTWLKLRRDWDRRERRFLYRGGPACHNLVLVFGPDGQLARHSLVMSQ